MKKMPCLFVRVFDTNPDRRIQKAPTITSTVTPGCEWVLAGEGVASRKRDGSACAILNGALYKRYDAKKDRKTGEYRMPPEGSIACDEPDAVTGHWPHWVKVGDEPESQWHREAWEAKSFLSKRGTIIPSQGTYELCGPKISGNPEGFDRHTFVRHGEEVKEVLRSLKDIQEFLREHIMEGIVFAHEDGRMAKIRRADFDLPWPPIRLTQEPKE